VCGFVASAKDTLERALGYAYTNERYNAALIALGCALGSVILVASVIVVSNAFRISAGERTRQFGVLKSVGATKKQITETVLYEGIFLSALGIPIGVAAGLLIELLGTSVITGLLNSLAEGGALNVDSEEFLKLSFVAPFGMFATAISVSFAAALLSAWFPARKAARVSAVDAIRLAGEVKLKSRDVKIPKLIRFVFGFPGVLAAKSLKRSKRAFRATVVSLSVAIALLISASGFGSLMKKTTNLMFPNIDATAVVDWSSELSYTYGENGQIAKVDYTPLDAAVADDATRRFREYGAEIFGVGGVSRYSAALPDGTVVSGALLSVDSEHYAELCKSAKVPVGSALLINSRRENIDGKIKESSPYDFKEISKQPITFTLAEGISFDIKIEGELREAPPEIINSFDAQIMVVAPKSETIIYIWYAKVADVSGFIKYAKPIIDSLPKSESENWAGASVVDIAAATGQIKSLVNAIMFFVYGFVGMLALIAVTSVISAVSANVRSRAREFAALQSVGMTKDGLKQALNLESVFCSAQSLVIGAPLGALCAYLLYKGMGIAAEIEFIFPWLAVAECAVGTFIITRAVALHSARRLESSSIVETLRSE
jgi:putative ABC transport system permease protein